MEYGFKDEDVYQLSTGTIIYANRGIIGLAPDGSIYGGYDEGVHTRGDLTDDEVRDVAAYMIEKWQALLWPGKPCKMP